MSERSDRRLAGIDCGTNSVRLLVADVLPGGALRDVVREMRIVRLGQDVDRTGVLAPAALDRTGAALREYATLIRDTGAVRTRMVATSATRDAANRDAFVALVRDVLDVVPEVVSGAEEAALSYAGAVAGLPDVPEPLLLADIGGGSTELVLGSGGQVERAHSMDVGSVRMTERHLRDDPPSAAQVAAVVADVRAALAGQPVPLDRASALVGVAGTVTTMAAIALGLPAYDSAAVHGSRMSAAEVARVTELLVGAPRPERAAIPVLHPGRVDVIAAGALVLRTLVEASGAQEVIASEHDILDGVVLSLRD